MQAEFVYQNDDFITEYDTKASVTQSEIKDFIVKLTINPSAELFWILSKIITVATTQDLSNVGNSLINIIKQNCNKFLGACFSAAHYINKMSETKKEDCQLLCETLKIPSCPLHAVQIIKLLTVDGIKFENYSHLFANPDISIQKSIAIAISQTCDNPEQLLEKYLNDISNETNYIRRRGLILICSELSYIEMPASKYIDALFPFILNKGKEVSELSAMYEAQNLLAKLTRHNPSAFHQCEEFLQAIQNQYESNNLSPEFLEAYLLSFGRSAIKSLSKDVLPQNLLNLPGSGKMFVKLFAPYVCHMNSDINFKFFNTLVDLCYNNRFDIELFDITSQAFAAMAPLVPPQIGKFLNAIEKSPISQRFSSIIGPLLQPKLPAPLQKLSTSVAVLPEEKHDIEIQCTPTRSDGGCQTEQAI
ncbi:hypothetical protein TVAG_055540 [Trichomonas vaginalis G3]|uniref:Uncharacterized protein n=1 Tax=Trichomonas vaginalis (strain ATCC PRA-98 / G3) TaxID=412133 RepID=A2EXZ7_TRIV3|nr:armadillo (ARM) repeat-containing protein family [Trichomonas vaginalis G3]EAY02465.1 hypothetical protein TVAG_055540 [Trichomonas vaginalis G3]KAI5511218.1 armadillo (ARM) repeat-containing protein family [Trichomonas vaginalis G3]|eukprot:XP_001314704.1 hypothetical protein [Trichomonas vaginalis G3]